jgi:hypothetical protein
MDTTRTEPFPTRHEAVKLILDIMQFAVFSTARDHYRVGQRKKTETSPPKTTTGLTEMEARDAMAWLYSRGRARVVEVRDGEEVWEVVYPGEHRKPTASSAAPATGNASS